jgi:hypothetical protein
MVSQRFARLDQATIAVELSQNGVKKTLRGTGAYDRDPDLGNVLRIKVHEPWGDFAVVLREDEFDGEITNGSTVGCDYAIWLSSTCACG